MKRLPPFDQLRALALVAETGSMTATAAVLNITQPAVSRRLRELESFLGVPLLRRGSNSVALTDAGAAYAEAVARGFAVIGAATDALAARSAAPLRIRAYTTWAMRWLIPRLPDFRARHPGVMVEVLTSTRAKVDFLREGIDAAICAGHEDRPPAPGALPLQRVEIAPFAVPAIRRRGRGGVLPPGVALLGSRIRPRDWDVWAAASNVTLPAAPMLFASTSLAIQAALEGLGAVITPPVFVAEDVRRRRLLPLAEGAVPTGDRYWLLLPARPRPDVASGFAAWLSEAAVH